MKYLGIIIDNSLRVYRTGQKFGILMCKMIYFGKKRWDEWVLAKTVAKMQVC